MAVKIFCNACQQFIRDAKTSEIASLKGTEICKDCDGRMNQLLIEIEKAHGRAIQNINSARDTAKAEIEEAKRRVIQKGGE
jgi:hypothetical protein